MAPSARDPIAVVAPAVDLAQIRSTLASQVAAHAREEQQATLADQAAARAHDRAREAALAIGRTLVDARKAFPRSGPKAAGWGELLAGAGIEERTARRWMELAGFVEVSDTPAIVSENPPRLPSAREVARGPLASPRVVLAPRAANLPTPAAQPATKFVAPTSAPAPRREQPRFVPDSQEEATPPEPVIVLDEGAVRAPPSRIAQAPAAAPARGQLSFGWAEAAAVAKKECRGMGAKAVAELVAEMCERTPGLRELLRRQLAGGVS